MFVPPGKLMHGEAQTTDEEDEAADERDELVALDELDERDELAALDVLIDDEATEERDDEDIEVELAVEDEAPADEPADEAIDELDTEEKEELLLALPVSVPGLKTCLPPLPQADTTRLAAAMVRMERIFIGNSHSG